MAENDQVSVRATHTDNKVAIHRVHGIDRRTLVGYYTPDEAEDIGLRIIREAGKARERIANKMKTLKAVA
jgi:hypothetical protein